MKKIAVYILALVTIMSLMTGCGFTDGLNLPSSTKSGGDVSATTSVITLNGDSAECNGGGVSISGSIVTVSAGGEYAVSGKLSDGQIVINTGEDPTRVSLTLNGADITCLTGPAIYVVNAKDVDLVLADGTENRVVSGTEADVAKVSDTSSGAAIYAEDDLDIEGTGSLEVLGYINNGIACKDDIDVNGGVITITAANNGLRGSESVTVNGGVLNINSQNDAIKTTSALKDGKGYVEINSGVITVNAGGDGISAETQLTLNGGEISITCTGDPALASSKAIKAKTALTANGGTLTLKSTDHAIHCTAGIDLLGGSFAIESTGGKAIAAHGDINISGGDYLIKTADDGIESKTAVYIGGGTLSIVSGKNGIKAGEKGNGFTGGTGMIGLTGGELYISSASDPLDSSGQMTVSGGKLLGLGVSKTLRSFDASSTQGFVSANVNGAAGQNVTISDESGELVSFTGVYGFNAVIFSDAGVTSGSSYIIASAGTDTEVTA